MPAPAARIRSANVPLRHQLGLDQALSRHIRCRMSRCEARVGAVKAQITFFTCPFWIIWPISGAAAGRVAPPRVVVRHAGQIRSPPAPRPRRRG